MAVPGELAKKIDDVAEVLRKAVERFNADVSAFQSRVLLRRILAKLDKLKTNKRGELSGFGLPTEVIRDILRDVRRLQTLKEYKRLGNSLTESMTSTRRILDVYYAGVVADFNAKNVLYERIYQQSTRIITAALLKSDINQAVVRDIASVLRKRNKTTPLNVEQMKTEVRRIVAGHGDDAGTLRRATSQIAHDVVYSQARQYEAALTEDLGFEWFWYAGSAISTSRDFCRDRHNKFFHRREVMSWNRLSWEGKKTGKYKTNIFVDVGGFNCRHQLSGVVRSFVPPADVARAKRLGFYNGD